MHDRTAHRVIVVGMVIALLALFVAPPALAGNDKRNSEAGMTIEVDCQSVEVTSSKDISNVKVFFTDGSRLEIENVDSSSFSETFDQTIERATSKSGTTTVEDDAGGCGTGSSRSAEDDDEPRGKSEKADDEDDESEDDDRATGNSAAEMTITVECDSVSVTSSKDISHVEVTFVDGTVRKYEGLSGGEWSETFDDDVAAASAKSGTTRVEGEAEDCDEESTSAAADDDTDDETDDERSNNGKRNGRDNEVAGDDEVATESDDEDNGNGNGNGQIEDEVLSSDEILAQEDGVLEGDEIEEALQDGGIKNAVSDVWGGPGRVVPKDASNEVEVQGQRITAEGEEVLPATGAAALVPYVLIALTLIGAGILALKANPTR